MSMLLILILQILLFVFICATFDYKNNIWFVLLAMAAIIPCLGIVASVIAMIIGYLEVFDCYPNLYLKDNKLNRWLYADYFNKLNR